MYKLRNMLDKSPNTIAAAIFAFVNFVASCIFLAADMKASPEFAGVLLSGETALVLILNLFVVQPNTVTNQVAQEQVSTAKAETTAEIHQYLADEPRARK